MALRVSLPRARSVWPVRNRRPGSSGRTNLCCETVCAKQGGKRQVELFVAPRGEIRYTLDGSEPRDGEAYDVPIAIGDGEVLLRVFATADGLETKEDFRFPARGKKWSSHRRDSACAFGLALRVQARLAELLPSKG